ncbi:hypothetical protein A0H76_494 [Hepatospora eriocheir]|uniref:C2 domain-containing protein n=1 Tax=Hepatospora eriocheir TaxID=1081669 RepID=A0A1X0QIN6_9MICR|nr:hypothetical protein A0H76_494 [Hepatospora eriocheir]
MDAKENSLIGYVSVNLSDINDLHQVGYKLRNCESGEIHLKFKIDFINFDLINENNNDNNNYKVEEKEKSESKNKEKGLNIGIYNDKNVIIKNDNFKKVIYLEVMKINSVGTYFIIIESLSDNYKLEPFNTNYQFDSSIVLPVNENEDKLTFRLFKITDNNVNLLGEDTLNLKSDRLTTENDNNYYFTIVFDRVRVDFKLLFSEIYDTIKESKNYKFVSLQFDKKKLSKLTLDEKMKSTLRYLENQVFVKSGSDDNIVNQTNLNSSKFSKLIDCANVKVFNCDFKSNIIPISGILLVYVMRLEDVSPASKTFSVEILVNGEDHYNTKYITNSKLFDYNEGFEININRYMDKIRFNVYEHTGIFGNKEFKSFKEIPLFNLKNGHKNFYLDLLDSVTGKISKMKLKVLLSFRSKSSQNK